MTNELRAFALLGAFAPEWGRSQKDEAEEEEDDENEKKAEKDVEETMEGYSE